jgi:hypothetical protein
MVRLPSAVEAVAPGGRKHSDHHRAEILASETCGCFYCISQFPPDSIDQWTGNAQTGLCPNCGIDSVIGDRSEFPVTTPFLTQMKQHWF